MAESAPNSIDVVHVVHAVAVYVGHVHVVLIVHVLVEVAVLIEVVVVVLVLVPPGIRPYHPHTHASRPLLLLCEAFVSLVLSLSEIAIIITSMQPPGSRTSS